MKGVVVMVLPTFEGFYNPLIHFNFVTYDFKNITRLSFFFIISIFLLELPIKVIFILLVHLFFRFLDNPLLLKDCRFLSFSFFLLLSLKFYLLKVFLRISLYLALFFYFFYLLLNFLLSSCIINVFVIQSTDSAKNC